MRKLVLLIVLIATMLLIPESTIHAPKPDVLPEAKAPTPVSSTFFLTVNVNRATLHDKLEAAIPPVYNGEGHGTLGDTITTSYDTQFSISREAINLSLGENSISMATHLSGSGNAVVPAHMLRPRISVTMEVAADIGINSTVTLNPDWNISSTTTTSLNVSKASTRILGFPVSAINDLEEALRPKMDNLANKVTTALNGIDARAPVEKAWKNLAKPILVDKKNSGWLSIRPSALYYSGFTNTGSGISAVIGVDAMITGVYGPRPKDMHIGSLPPFQTVAPTASGFNINLPVFASYKELREPLKKEVIGKILELDNGAKVEVKGANLYGNGERIVVTLDITAVLPGKWLSTKGRIYFSGKPVFDKTTNGLSLQGFDYDVKTKDYLLVVANGLFHESLRDKIANKLSWDLTSRLQAAKLRANKNLAHVSLKNGASVKGSVDTMRVNGVYPLSTGIQIGTVLKGNLSIEF